jgi:hypothetical protein
MRTNQEKLTRLQEILDAQGMRVVGEIPEPLLIHTHRLNVICRNGKVQNRAVSAIMKGRGCPCHQCKCSAVSRGMQASWDGRLRDIPRRMSREDYFGSMRRLRSQGLTIAQAKAMTLSFYQVDKVPYNYTPRRKASELIG